METPRIPSREVDRLRKFFVRDNSVLGLTIDTRYRVVFRIGQGGMGDVFYAVDERLNRPVAMKVLALLRPRPEWIATLRAEAQIMSALEHPGIVPVYDLGTLPDGRVYFTMKYVEGQTFDRRIRAGADRSALIRRLAEACGTVHHAHEAGVLHRDLKPANLMVDDAERVFVMDWGIARSQETEEVPSGLSGTLAYMAPEQARGLGQQIDRRTDVFGLGAILFEILTGLPPVEGATEAERLGAAQAGRIAPLPPGIPRDLGAICRKALHPEQALRYATALDLRDDLLAHLEGRPVQALAEGPLARSLKAMRRHPRLATLATAALILLISTAFLFGRTGRQATEISKLATRVLEEMREAGRQSLDSALRLRRAGDLSGMKQQSKNLEVACAKVIGAFPALAEPHYLLGRLCRAQNRHADAREHLTEALRKEPGHAPSRFERGLLLWMQYRVELRECRTGWSAPQSDDPSERLVDPMAPTASVLRLRQEALNDLSGLSDAFARAMVASLREDEGQAFGLFQQALGEDEATWWAWAEALVNKDDFQESVKVLTEGLRRDRGYWPFMASRARIYIMLGGSAKEPCRRADFQRKAISDAEEALQMGADTSMYFTRGVARYNLSNEIGLSDKEQLDRCVEALADLERDTIERTPLHNSLKWATRATAHYRIAEHRDRLRGDPEGDLQRCLEACAQALKQFADNARALVIRAQVEAHLAELKEMRGDAACEDGYRRSIASMDRYVALRPGSWQAHFHLACARQALWQRSALPEESVRKILSDYETATRLNPTSALIWKHRTFLHLEQVRRATQKKDDATPAFEAALKSVEKSLRLDPSQADLWRMKVSVCLNWAGYRAMRSEDGILLLREAIQAADREMQVAGRTWDSLQGRVLAVSILIQQLKSAKGPGTELPALIEAYGRDSEELLRLAPAHGDYHVLRANYYRLVESWAEAQREFEKAITLDPARAPHLTAEIENCRARLSAKTGNP